MKLRTVMRQMTKYILVGTLCAGIAVSSVQASTYEYNEQGTAAKKQAADSSFAPKDGQEFHAYMMVTVQDSWVYRSRFFEKGKGVDYDNFNQLVTSLQASDPVPVGGKFEDAIIAGNGHYTVKLTGINGCLAKGAESTASLAILGFTTDIPYDKGITFDNVNVKIDGIDKGTRSGSNVYYDKDDKEDPGLCTVELANTWHDECQNPLNLGLAQDSIEISFDVKGFSYDNPKAAASTKKEATTEEKKADKTNDNNSKTIVPITAAVVVIILVCGVCIVVKKKKEH